MVDTFEEYVDKIKDPEFKQPEYFSKDLMYMISIINYNSAQLCNTVINYDDPSLEVFCWRIIRSCANILIKLDLGSGYASIGDGIMPISNDIDDFRNILTCATAELTRNILNVYEFNYCSDIYTIDEHTINEIYASMDLIMNGMVSIIWAKHTGYNMNDIDEVFPSLMHQSLFL